MCFLSRRLSVPCSDFFLKEHIGGRTALQHVAVIEFYNKASLHHSKLLNDHLKSCIHDTTWVHLGVGCWRAWNTREIFIHRIRTGHSLQIDIQWSGENHNITVVSELFVNVSIELVNNDVNFVLSMKNAWKDASCLSESDLKKLAFSTRGMLCSNPTHSADWSMCKSRGYLI